jgi:hypothetical protein
VLATDVVIEGFAFTGTLAMANAVYSRWVGPGSAEWGDGLTVRQCHFDSNVNIGINLEFVYYADVHHNVFSHVDNYGIYADPAKSAPGYGMVHDNVFDDVGTTAIELDEASHMAIHGNRFFNGTAAGGGAAPNCFINLAHGDDNLVTENWQSCILPLAGVGDWDNCNSASATDAWVGNHLMNGLAVTNPT